MVIAVVIVISVGMLLINMVVIVVIPYGLVVVVKEVQYRKYCIYRYICSVSYIFSP